MTGSLLQRKRSRRQLAVILAVAFNLLKEWVEEGSEPEEDAAKDVEVRQTAEEVIADLWQIIG